MPAIVRARLTRIVAGLALVALGFALLVPAPVEAQERILRVPGEYATIQDAVDAAQPGDLVLVGRGTYNEAVEVPEEKTGITIRGIDRNEVILDGEHAQGNAITVRADGVTLENMSATGYLGNGFYWRSVEGYHGRYLTAWNIGLYGIYAFDSVVGVFEHSYASGSADASFYIGQCYPCDALIENVIGEYSALGYSGTNSGGNLIIRDSVWTRNAAGIVPNSLDSQANPPQRGVEIVNNVIADNGTVPTPASGIAGAIQGHGVGIAGGVENVVEGNEITGNAKWGVVIFPLPDENIWLPEDNVIRGNFLRDNGAGAPLSGADLALSAAVGTGNCFEDNDFETSRPLLIEETFACGLGLGELPLVGDPAVAAELIQDFAEASGGLTDRPSYRDMPAPDPQPNMPGADPGDEPAVDEDETEEEPEALTPLPATGGGLGAIALGLALLASGLRGFRRE